ncbi:hypothetical protein IIA79_00770 [bacterium]|nr:hypothetical protein [bacterium]
MRRQPAVLERMVMDFAVVGVVGGLGLGIWRGEEFGFSFLAACLWLALNFTALTWLLTAYTSPRRPSGLFIFALACAKIPASYLILFWLYRVEYLEVVGLTVGLVMLPMVLLFRGLISRFAPKTGEEG